MVGVTSSSNIRTGFTVSGNQIDVLWTLWCCADPVSTRYVADEMVDAGMLKRWNAQDIAHGRLVRLHSKGLVEREGYPARWSLTKAGLAIAAGRELNVP